MIQETDEWLHDFSYLSVNIDGNLIFCMNIPYVKVEVSCHTVFIYYGKCHSVHLDISRNIMMISLEEEGSYKILEKWNEIYNKSLGCMEYQYGKLARRRVHNVNVTAIMLAWLNDDGFFVASTLSTWEVEVRIYNNLQLVCLLVRQSSVKNSKCM